MQQTLNDVEQFLLHIEQNEVKVFDQYPDYVLLPIVPFFQLVHVQNTYQVFEQLMRFEPALGGFLVRVEGHLTLACAENIIREDDVRRLTIQLIEAMRF